MGVVEVVGPVADCCWAAGIVLFEGEGYWSLIGEGFRGSGVAVIPGVTTWMDRGGCTLLRVIVPLMSDVFGYFLPARGAG